MNNEELSKVEVMVMKVIWSTSERMQLCEIVDLVNRRFEKSWKPQTISTYLRRLVKKGFISPVRLGSTYVYAVLIGEQEYMAKEIRHFVDVWGKDSPAGFVAALNKEKLLETKQKEELRRLLNDMD